MRVRAVVIASLGWTMLVACESRPSPPPVPPLADPHTTMMPTPPAAPTTAPTLPPGVWPGTPGTPAVPTAPGATTIAVPHQIAGLPSMGLGLPAAPPVPSAAVGSLPAPAPADPRACERLQACCIAIAATPGLGAVEPQCEQGLFAAAAVRQFGSIGEDDENPLRNQDSTACSIAMVAVLQSVSDQMQLSHGTLTLPPACRYSNTVAAAPAARP